MKKKKKIKECSLYVWCLPKIVSIYIYIYNDRRTVNKKIFYIKKCSMLL